MDLGGYISFTIGGFRCLPFGAPAISETIARSNSALDIAQSIALRPGRVGFRRTLLDRGDRPTFVYSCFVGVAEPNANRLGSFLSVGMAFEREIDCVASDIGTGLNAMLADLLERVSMSYKFKSDVSVEAVNEFLGQNTPMLEEVQRHAVPLERALLAKSTASLLLLSEERLSLAISFNRACNLVPPHTGFYFFEAAHRQEFEASNYDFKVSTWPQRPVDTETKSQSLSNRLVNSSAAAGSPSPEVTGSSPSGDSGKEMPRVQQLQLDLEKIDVFVQRSVVELDGKLRLLKIWVGAASLILFVMVLVLSGFAYYWHDMAIDDGKELRRQVDRVRSEEHDPASSRYASGDLPVQPLLAQGAGGEREDGNLPRTAGAQAADATHLPGLVVKLAEKATVEELRKAHCSKMKPDEFAGAFKKVNPEYRGRGVIAAESQVQLPAECGRQR